jgi:hypothetical protein
MSPTIQSEREGEGLEGWGVEAFLFQTGQKKGMKPLKMVA